jgi:deoxyribose-phosphate aldolase
MNINDIVKKVTDEVYMQMGDAKASAPKCIDSELAGHIEHSILNPDMTRDKIITECALAKQYRFANVCVTPYFVYEAEQALKLCNVGICAPVGFPQGAASIAAKLCEIKECVANGATELDVELNIVAIKSGEFAEAKRELMAMVAAAGFGVKVKAIYEQGLFTDEEKRTTLEIIRDVGPAYVKISNALTGKAACVEDVAFVRGIVGDAVKIKIDGGIKNAAKAREILLSGADRIGCSASVAIVTGE